MLMSPRKGGHPSSSRVESNDAIVSRLTQQDKAPWYRKHNLRLLYLIILPTCLGVEVTCGFDASMLNGLQAVPSWLEYFHHPRSGLLGLTSAMYALGGIAAVPFVPSVVDKFGRRHSILIGSMLTVTGALLQGAALSLAMFNVARFILGFGIIFAIVAASSLIAGVFHLFQAYYLLIQRLRQELSHPKERADITSLFNTSFMVGSLSAAGVTLGTFAIPNNLGWRIPSFFQAVPSLLQLTFVWFLPESPRWLISKGRGDEAHAILVKYHAEGDEDSEFVKAEYIQIEQTLAEEMRNAQMSWVEVFSSRGMRRRVIVVSFLALFIKWSGNGLISYFLSPILDSIGIHDNRMKNIVNFANAGWNLVNATFLAITVPRYPRRGVYLACSISLFVILVAWTVASAEYALTRSLISVQAVLVLIFLHSPAYNLAFTSLTYTYLVEIFPFHVRARGIAIFLWWNRAAAFATQFIDPIGIEAAGWKYYIIYCVWIAFGAVFIYVMFPETSGRTLEELTFLYDDDHEHVPRNAEIEPLLHEHLTETYDAIEGNSSKVGRMRRE